MQPPAIPRPDPLRPRTWPLALKVPIQAALFTVLVAAVTTQAALFLAREREDRALEAGLGALADGVALAAVPAIAAGEPAVGAVLARFASGGAGGLVEGVLVAWTDADGVARTAQVGTVGAPGPHAVTRAADLGTGADTVTVTVVADEAALAAGRLGDQVRIVVVDFALALLGALVALWAVRRTLAPVEALTAALVAAPPAGRVPATTFAPLSTEFGRLQRVMNDRIKAEEERAAALYRLAEQERDAGLAKLAASMAHEVRNPLAGLMNAVSTLRRFGGDPAVRAESLDLVERGLRSIERVASAALSTYRPVGEGSPFGPSDLSDLRVLVAPEARRRGVALDWRVDLDGPVAVDADRLRQAVLNLLLNAVKASGEGGRMGLSAALRDGELVIAVSDTGPGLPGDVRRFLAGGPDEPFPRPGALGLWTVVRLLDDVDGRLTVDTHPGRGTTVTVRVAAAAAAGPAAATLAGTAA